MASSIPRRFGTELSENVSSLVTPQSSLKRPAPSFYKDRSDDDNRPGKKPRSLGDFNFHFRDHGYVCPPQKKRVEYSRSRRTKIDVILFLKCHRIVAKKGPRPTPPKRKSPSARTKYENRLAEWHKDQYVAPTLRQAAAWFLIPYNTISYWWKQREDIFRSRAGSRMVQKTWICCWPEMEDRLFQLFSERRNAGYTVRRWWFRKMSIKLFREFYVDPLRAQGKENDASEMESLFVFSSGWFDGFCRRNRVALRRLTRVVRIYLS
jgi:Tc5 transposase DNA-binding domain